MLRVVGLRSCLCVVYLTCCHTPTYLPPPQEEEEAEEEVAEGPGYSGLSEPAAYVPSVSAAPTPYPSYSQPEVRGGAPVFIAD